MTGVEQDGVSNGIVAGVNDVSMRRRRRPAPT